jgi:hypothetical protein
MLIDDLSNSEDLISKSIQLKKVNLKVVAEIYAELIRTKSIANVLMAILIEAKLTDKAELEKIIDEQMMVCLDKLENVTTIETIFSECKSGQA